jgi:hypothetical protein
VPKTVDDLEWSCEVGFKDGPKRPELAETPHRERAVKSGVDFESDAGIQ